MSTEINTKKLQVELDEKDGSSNEMNGSNASKVTENNENEIAKLSSSRTKRKGKSNSPKRKARSKSPKNSRGMLKSKIKSQSCKRHSKSKSPKKGVQSKLSELERKSLPSKERTTKKRTTRVPIEIFKGGKYLHYLDQVKEKEGRSTYFKSEKQTESQDEKKAGETHVKVTNFSVIRELLVRPSKYKIDFSRHIKMTQYMDRPFLILDEHMDYTPKPLVKPENSNWIKNPLMFRFSNEKSGEFKPDLALLGTPSKATLSFDRNIFKPFSENIGCTMMAVEDDNYSLPAPSMYYLVYPEQPPLNKGSISIKLTETPEIILLSIISQTSAVGDKEGKEIAEANKIRIELNKRLRKTVSNCAQTSMKYNSIRTKETQLSRKPRVNSYCYISNWDFFDTMEEVREKFIAPPEKIKIGKVDTIKYSELKSQDEIISMKNFKVIDRLNWFRTEMIIERLLLSNNATKRQLIFYDLLKSDPLKKDIEYKYSLQRLWTLKTDKTKGRTVTAMSWNAHKQNILAVGYGKYSFTDSKDGLVCIWNNKNLAYPEREYEFKHPVTCVRFCKSYPAILAIAFYSGLVILINITKHHGIKVVAQSIPLSSTLVYPVWQIAWLFKVELNKERLVECKADGSVYEYIKGHLHEKKLIMKISKVKDIVKGIAHRKRCQPYALPLVSHPAVLCIALNPILHNEYFLGSNEGAVYKCTLQDVHQHVEMFLAHDGPVYTIQFHPACSKIFLTCGADWYIRVWADGIFTPLLTMISGMSAIESACWFPNNPTLIAGITNKNIEIWDISRKVNFPQAIFTNPNNQLNTSMAFTECGNNMCIGDYDGNVYVYTFNDMPFPPSNPDMVLGLVLLKALVTRPKLVEQLKRMGPPFNIPKIIRSLFNLH